MHIEFYTDPPFSLLPPTLFHSITHTHDVNVNVFVVCFKQLKKKMKKIFITSSQISSIHHIIEKI